MLNNAESLNASLSKSYLDGYASLGDLGLGQEEYKSHLIHITEKYLGVDAQRQTAINFVGNLHTRDLYLGLACAQRTDLAWNYFIANYGKYIKSLASYMSSNSDSAIELADDVTVDLFLPDTAGHSRIASYEGRSSLATWLRVVISHRATNERERICNNMDSAENLPEIADRESLLKIDASLRNFRYEHIIADSFHYSCKCLTERERLILLLRYDEKLRLGEIADLLDMHQSTVTRQLMKIYKKLRDEMIGIFSSKYHLDRAAIDECQEDILESSLYSILPYIKLMQSRD
jgi:RNA polymerase sigma-70 factor